MVMRCCVWIVGGMLLFSTQALANKCFRAAKAKCREARTLRYNTCREHLSVDAREFCRRQRKESLPRCKEIAATIRKACKNHRVTAKMRASCHRRQVQSLARCRGLATGTSACRLRHHACQRRCFKSCEPCTMGVVKQCVAKCKLILSGCARTSSDQDRRCRRSAAQLGRMCVRGHKLNAWSFYYRCLNRSTAASLRCQWKSYDKERACYQKNSDTYRMCMRRRRAAYDLCIATASKRCGV